jgi:NADP-dependent 3-hydroxy acid dehydrogenase YdfG
MDLIMKRILVTGANSGIGAAIVHHLSHNGFFVYAPARKSEDLNKLNKVNNVRSLNLDITNHDQIRSVSEFVKQEAKRLNRYAKLEENYQNPYEIGELVVNILKASNPRI